MAILEAQVRRRSPATQTEKSWQINRKPIKPKRQEKWIIGPCDKQMGIEKVNELKGARKERKRKPWAVYDVENENGPRQAQSNESKESKGLMVSP